MKWGMNIACNCVIIESSTITGHVFDAYILIFCTYEKGVHFLFNRNKASTIRHLLQFSHNWIILNRGNMNKFYPKRLLSGNCVPTDAKNEIQYVSLTNTINMTNNTQYKTLHEKNGETMNAKLRETEKKECRKWSSRLE